MRVRLTLSVGLVSACFLALSAYLLSTHATDRVLAGVRADQVTYVQSVASVEPPVGVAVDTFGRLAAAGLLDTFYDALGTGRPAAGQGVSITDGTTTVAVAGGEAVTGAMRIPASLVVELGEPLLSGMRSTDFIVVSGGGSAAVTGGGLPADPAGATMTGAVSAVPITNVRSSVQDLGRNLWIGAGLLTLLAMGATWLLTGRALRPVEAISSRVEAIDAAGTGERVPVPAAHDEIGHLARTVNTMLDRLDGASLAQHRFVADASHELRSPLAVIRAETEVALAHPDGADWARMGRTVLHETNRLEDLVTDLLLLARRDDLQPMTEGLHPSTDVEEVVLAEAARTRRVPVDTRRVLAGRVAGRPADVARVARHLLDNAARHAAAEVEVAVTVDGPHVVLVVDDDGAGVPEAERANIFERFARLDDARSRDQGGAGLGLAVVAAVVNDLGGTVTVGQARLGGARFEVRLPAMPSGDAP